MSKKIKIPYISFGGKKANQGMYSYSSTKILENETKIFNRYLELLKNNDFQYGEFIKNGGNSFFLISTGKDKEFLLLKVYQKKKKGERALYYYIGFKLYLDNKNLFSSLFYQILKLKIDYIEKNIYQKSETIDIESIDMQNIEDDDFIVIDNIINQNIKPMIAYNVLAIDKFITHSLGKKFKHKIYSKTERDMQLDLEESNNKNYSKNDSKENDKYNKSPFISNDKEKKIVANIDSKTNKISLILIALIVLLLLGNFLQYHSRKKIMLTNENSILINIDLKNENNNFKNINIDLKSKIKQKQDEFYKQSKELHKITSKNKKLELIIKKHRKNLTKEEKLTTR